MQSPNGIIVNQPICFILDYVILWVDIPAYMGGILCIHGCVPGCVVSCGVVLLASWVVWVSNILLRCMHFLFLKKVVYVDCYSDARLSRLVAMIAAWNHFCEVGL